jgi:hypothetical protein
MRTANFKTDVLHAVVYRLGYDPETNFQKNQAYAYASYVNAWVRRLWDLFDQPEWTVIGRFSVQTAPGLEHIVGYSQPPIEFIPPPMGSSVPDAPAPGAVNKPLIGKVLKVYLIDPRTTWTPAETPFRLEHVGIHCGFEHGNSVWIKYVVRAPKYSAREWDPGVTYKLEQVTYAPDSGECYISKSNGNRGHSPESLGDSGMQEVLTTEITREFVPANPGVDEKSQIIDVFAGFALDLGHAPSPLPDPPPNFSVFDVKVLDATGTMIGEAAYFADGVITLSAVFTDLVTQLSATPALSTFTFTLLTGPLRIRMENLSSFSVNPMYFQDAVNRPLATQQIQSYSPAIAASDATPKQIRLSMATEDVIPGSTYQLTFTSLDNAQHTAVYTSLGTDGPTQIMDGLINAMIALQGADPFFSSVQSSLDTVSPSVMFTISPTIAKASLNAVTVPPGSIWWSYVPFPLALVEQVVRGVVADVRGEQGQTDKEQAENQMVPAETKLQVGTKTGNEYDPLTDQQRPHSRYSVK